MRDTISKTQATDSDLANILSIKHNADYLLEQLKDFDFIHITKEESEKINNIDIKFNSLVAKIGTRPEA